MDLFKIFGNKSTPKDVAKDRLKLILIHDRTDFSPEILEMIKSDILKVISNYVDIDSEDVEVAFTKTDVSEGNLPALVANIPIKKMKAK